MTLLKLLGCLGGLAGILLAVWRANRAHVNAAVAQSNEAAERDRVAQMTAAEESARQVRERKLDEKVTAVRGAADAARLLRDVSDDSQVN